MRISDWSSDVCSSDLRRNIFAPQSFAPHREEKNMSIRKMIGRHPQVQGSVNEALALAVRHMMFCSDICTSCADACIAEDKVADLRQCIRVCLDCADVCDMAFRSEEHTSELQSLMRISYAVFC